MTPKRYHPDDIKDCTLKGTCTDCYVNYSRKVCSVMWCPRGKHTVDFDSRGNKQSRCPVHGADTVMLLHDRVPLCESCMKKANKAATRTRNRAKKRKAQRDQQRIAECKELRRCTFKGCKNLLIPPDILPQPGVQPLVSPQHSGWKKVTELTEDDLRNARIHARSAEPQVTRNDGATEEAKAEVMCGLHGGKRLRPLLLRRKILRNPELYQLILDSGLTPEEADGMIPQCVRQDAATDMAWFGLLTKNRRVYHTIGFPLSEWIHVCNDPD